MTYHRTFKLALEKAPFEAFGTHCFCCGQEFEGPTMEYHAFPFPGRMRSVLMHRDCAFAMAQRIIMDTWPHRTDDHPIRVTGI